MVEKLGKISKEKQVSGIDLITRRSGIPPSFYSSMGFSENRDVMVMGRAIE